VRAAAERLGVNHSTVPRPIAQLALAYPTLTSTPSMIGQISGDPRAFHVNTGLVTEASPARDAWTIHFLHAKAAEAADAGRRLMDLEWVWFEARASVAGRRRHSHAPAVVDLLAAAPLVSATTLAEGMGLAVKTTIGLAEEPRQSRCCRRGHPPAAAGR
jgi:hypothetical protein